MPASRRSVCTPDERVTLRTFASGDTALEARSVDPTAVSTFGTRAIIVVMRGTLLNKAQLVHGGEAASATRDQAWVGAAALFSVLTTAFVAIVAFRIGGDWFSNAVDDLGEVVAALVAATACAVTSRRVGRASAGWAFMALSSLSWACGEAIWSYYDLIRGIELPSPSAADLGFLAAVPLAVVGLHKMFPRPPRRGTRLGQVLGGMVVGSGVLVVVWAVTLLRDPQGSELLQRLVGLAYPLGDLIMAMVVLGAFARGIGDRTTMHLVLAGIVSFTVADTWFAVVVTVGDFGLPYWLDAGWVLGYFLIALGALRASHDVGRVTARTAAVQWTGAATYRGGALPVPALVGGSVAIAPTRRVTGNGQHWLAKANTDHLVNYAAMFLVAVDASVVLYDLGSILKMLA